MDKGEVPDLHELYREHTSVGQTLMETLNELISENRIAPEVARKVVSKFDECFAKTLEKDVITKIKFKGTWTLLYKQIDPLWEC